MDFNRLECYMEKPKIFSNFLSPTIALITLFGRETQINKKQKIALKMSSFEKGKSTRSQDITNKLYFMVELNF